ncbi:hypothetical protein J6590_079907 [Homalodisca vitripennis]|nr:hypothetical protein J6590_079907 [Homalodisca vitripennis]
MNENQKRIEASVEVTLVETVADTKKHGQSSVLLQELMLIQIHILMHNGDSLTLSFCLCAMKKGLLNSKINPVAHPLATDVILTSRKGVLNQHRCRVQTLNKHPLRIRGGVLIQRLDRAHVLI